MAAGEQPMGLVSEIFSKVEDNECARDYAGECKKPETIVDGYPQLI